MDELRNKLDIWVNAVGLEEALADNDLEPVDALLHLYECGLIKLPDWLLEAETNDDSSED